MTMVVAIIPIKPATVRNGRWPQVDLRLNDTVSDAAAGNLLQARDAQRGRAHVHTTATGTQIHGRADDRNAVVDSAGRVYGVSGLRVVDASVMPNLIAGNTNVPVIMIAEKMAAAISAGA